MQMYLFPLPRVVLYPGTVKPLNIFEPRYIRMIHDSITNKIPIVLGFVDEPGKKVVTVPGVIPNFVRHIAGYGHPMILEERKDGSLLVVVQGQGTVEVGEVVDSEAPYVVVSSRPKTEPPVYGVFHQEIDELKRILFGWVMTHVPEPIQQRHFIDSVKTADEVVGCLASFVVQDPDLQQLILEEDQPATKIQLLKSIIVSTDFRREAA